MHSGNGSSTTVVFLVPNPEAGKCMADVDKWADAQGEAAKDDCCAMKYTEGSG